MASMVVKTSSCNQTSPLFQEKASRNKRKFRADPPLGDPSNVIPAPQNECVSYEFCAEKFGFTPCHGQADACNLCGVSTDHSHGLKLALGLSSAIGSSEVGPSETREDIEADDFQDADWSELTEAQLEELVLSNLDAIIKSAIKKIISCGYTEEVATKAVLRSGLCYGCKDTVSNIVDNTLMFLKGGQDMNSSRGRCFEDLEQLEKYILVELVCILREVRPFFSIGDAMWCLLICDMNVSHACAMDGNFLSSYIGDGASNGTSSQPSSRSKAKSSESDLPNSCKSIPSTFCSLSPEIEARGTGVSNSTKSDSSFFLNGMLSEKDYINSPSYTVDKTFSPAGTSQSFASEDRFVGSRTVYSTKREYIIRQRSFHLEKNYRTFGSKGSSRAKLSSLGSLILDKKLKSLSDSAAVDMKSSSLKITNAISANGPQDKNPNFSFSTGPTASAVCSLDNSTTISGLPKTNDTSSLPSVNVSLASSEFNMPAALSTADAKLCLLLPTKHSYAPVPPLPHSEALNPMYSQMPNDRSVGQWIPQDKKDEMILKLVPRVRELQNQLQQWTEWANQKVMQAARRLRKDNAELKTLRQEKEEAERLKKEKMTLEENTRKKLNEMESSLNKASGQVERANAAVRRLEAENAALRQEMDSAKLHATQSSVNCQEALNKEKRTQQRYQSWEKERTLLQEELMTGKHRVAQLLHELEQANVLKEQWEARLTHEEKAKEELLTQASALNSEREQIEASAKSKEDVIKSKAETNLHKYKNDIQKLQKEISHLRLKTDSSKIAALRRGIDGNYAGRVADIRNTQKDQRMPFVSKLVPDLQDFSGTGGVKRERECVMCLSEEMSVVFLPCAHQVVCTTCNELHEKQGMKECPSCRTRIQRRIPVRYART